mmetsp:Transcript_37770/g.70464  ORF Transcript_37770/g.70464 Transcript_37770/m.70464 type:complete len:130 (+) Transcript_37770:47-436(+)
MRVCRVAVVGATALLWQAQADTACRDKTSDSTSILQVVEFAPRDELLAAKPPVKHENGIRQLGSALESADHPHNKDESSTGTDAQAVEMTDTKSNPKGAEEAKTSRHDNKMFQDMLEAWGNYIGKLLFG